MKAKAHPSAKAQRSAGEAFEDLLALQQQLLGTGGCPWDREQTHESLKPFLVEEAYEVLDALDGGDARKFAEELGDLLLQIVFHAELAKNEGKFDIRDVMGAVHEKMVRRHPHVFGSAQAKSSEEVLKNWEEMKAEERSSKKRGAEAESALAALPRGLPSLLEAYQLTRRASNIGFDWENIEGIVKKLREEIAEMEEVLEQKPKRATFQAKLQDEIGDILFTVVNIARFAGADPDMALRRSNAKFKKRFQWMEKAAREQGKKLARVPRGEMERLWNQSKARV